MHRFYADPMLSDERRFFLNADDTVHAVKVLRIFNQIVSQSFYE